MLKNLIVSLLAALSVAAVSTPAYASGFYTGVYGGANFTNDDDYSSKWLNTGADTGMVIGAVVGTKIESVPGLRVEGDLSYRENKVDVSICHDSFKASDSTWGLLANAVYDIDYTVLGLKPYILVGAGYASRTGEVNNSTFSVGNSGFAWQVVGGFNYAVSSNVDLGLGYRYFDGPDLTVGPVGSEGTNHSLIASATFSFN